jgi:hypothetical protein
VPVHMNFWWRLRRKKRPSSHQRGDPTPKQLNGLGTNKNLVIGSDGRPEPMNDCADEDQQRLTAMLYYYQDLGVTIDGEWIGE